MFGFQLRKEVTDLNTKITQQQSVVQDSKENIKMEIKEEESVSGDSGVQVKEEPGGAPIKKETDDEAQVCFSHFAPFQISLV